VPVDGQVRIGSNTKPFTAVTVLQLVGEGKIDLDKPIETYLPDLIRGDGIDGRHITVRQLLQHTSGLPNYTIMFKNGVLPYQHTYFQPRELLDMALKQKADFAPGTKWEYSNTNYIVAGLLIEKVTGRPLNEEITHRVIHRIGLRHTYFPNVGDQTIREPHPHGYAHDDPKAPLTDVTEMDPSQGWAAGEIISTPSDINHFFSALLAGKLLPPAQLKEMRTTLPAPELGSGVRYGLGLSSTPLSCGGLAWGHGGDFPGYHTTNAATENGRAATIAVTQLPSSLTQINHLTADLDTALCK
jgi:D-alanyl-D-alanine carboxypeptidase